MRMKKELLLSLILGFFGLLFLVFLMITRQSPQSKQDRQDMPATTASLSLMETQPSISSMEMEKHALENDCWIIVDGNVFDVTGYMNIHPDGPDLIIPYCGKDATEAYATKNGKGPHSEKADQDLQTLYVGTFEDSI